MSSKPAWLDDDDVSDDNSYGDTGSPDIRTWREAPVAPMPTPPRAPPTKNESAFLRSPTTQHVALPRNTDDDLEANGLGFLKSDGNNYLRKAPARKDDASENDFMSEISSFASSQLDKNPLKATKSTKNGLLLEDMTGAPPTTNAPVHFIKRMQEAEKRRQERLIASPPTSGAPSSNRATKVKKVSKAPTSAGVSTNPLQRTLSSSSMSSSSSSSSSLSFSSEVPEEDRVEARLAKSQKREERTRVKVEKRQAKKNAKKNDVLSSGGNGSGSTSLGGTMNSNASMAKTLNEAMGLEQIDTTNIEPEEAPVELDEKAKVEFSDVIECFGEEIAKLISSKKYSHRCTGIAKAERAVVAAQHRDDDKQHMEVDDRTEDAFNDILVNAMGDTGEFNTPPPTPPPTRTPDAEDDEHNSATFINTQVNTHSLVAFFHVIDKSVADTVIPVCRAGCSALVGVVDCIRDVPPEALGWGDLPSSASSPSTIASVVASLVKRLKDSNNKVRESVTSAITSIGKHKSISGTELVLSITKDGSEDAGHLIAKIDVAQTLLETTDIYKPDVSNALLNLAVSALSCSSLKTRKRGVSFFTYLNMVLGDTAETNNVDIYLTKVNPSTVKMLKQELNMAENDVFGPSKSLKGAETVNTASSTIQKTQARRDEIDDVAQLESEEVAGNLSLEQLKKIAKYQDAFGEVVPSIGCVESSQWKLRERAIGRLVKSIKDGLTISDVHLGTLVDIASASLADSVPAVANVCLAVLKEIVTTQLGGSRGKMLLKLCGQLAKLTNLTTEAACNASADEGESVKAVEADDAALILLSLAKSVGSHQISKELVTQPLSGSNLPVDKMFLKGPLKVVGGRLDILTMITNVTTTDRNVDLTMLMQTATTAFGHAQSKVRLSAAALITSLYRRFGEQIRPFLTGISGAAAEELRKRMSSLTKRDKAKAGVGKKLAIFRGGAHDEDVDVPVMSSPRPPHAPSSQASPHTSLRNRIAAANKPPPSPPQTGQQKLNESSNGVGTTRLNAEPVLLGNGSKPSLSSRKGNLVFS